MARPPLTHLCWVDLETTGSHRNEDLILEVAAVVTDVTLEELGSWSTPIAHPGESWMKRLENNPYVMNMHVKNGLVSDILNGNAMSVADCEAELLALLDMHTRPHHVALAGSGVQHFDRSFIREAFPKFDRFLAFYEVDMGSIRRFLRDVCGRTDLLLDDEQVSKTHRALDDIRQHLAEARHYQHLIGRLP